MGIPRIPILNRTTGKSQKARKIPAPPAKGFKLIVPTIEELAKKKAKKPRKRKTKSTYMEREMLIEKLNACPYRLVGIDMSLNNPGMVILEPHHKLAKVYYFRNTRSNISSNTICTLTKSVLYDWVIQCICIERDKDDDGTNKLPNDLAIKFGRYNRCVGKLFQYIGDNKDGMTRVGIEGYAKNARFSQEVLTELGGILRNTILNYGHIMAEYAPTFIKNAFTNGGGAKKEVMVKAYENDYEFPDLYPIMGITRLHNGKVRAKVPNPLDDVVDAMAVAMVLLDDVYKNGDSDEPDEPCAKRRKK